MLYGRCEMWHRLVKEDYNYDYYLCMYLKLEISRWLLKYFGFFSQTIEDEYFSWEKKTYEVYRGILDDQTWDISYFTGSEVPPSLPRQWQVAREQWNLLVKLVRIEALNIIVYVDVYMNHMTVWHVVVDTW